MSEIQLLAVWWELAVGPRRRALAWVVALPAQLHLVVGPLAGEGKGQPCEDWGGPSHNPLRHSVHWGAPVHAGTISAARGDGRGWRVSAFGGRSGIQRHIILHCKTKHYSDTRYNLWYFLLLVGARAGYRVQYFLGTDRIASMPFARYQILMPKGLNLINVSEPISLQH